jgi:arginine N-succinyltransferase
MNAIWQFRFAQSEELSALGSWRAGADWENSALEDAFVSHAVQGAPADSRVLLAYRVAGEGSKVLGGIRLQRRIGIDQPRYWYHMGCVVHAAAELGLFQRERTLLLGNDLTGAFELSELHFDNTQLTLAEQTQFLRQLLHVALAIFAQELPAPQSAEKVIFALPGLRDASGNAPFWEGLGRHFYPGDVAAAQARFGSAWLTHVAALLPRHPLVVSLLTQAAQAAIGEADTQTQPLRAALANNGFRAGQHVTLFDAGPVFETILASEQAVPNWRKVKLAIAEQIVAASTLLTTQWGQQIWQIPAQLGAQTLSVTADIALALGLQAGSGVWVEGAP